MARNRGIGASKEHQFSVDYLVRPGGTPVAGRPGRGLGMDGRAFLDGPGGAESLGSVDQDAERCRDKLVDAASRAIRWAMLLDDSSPIARYLSRAVASPVLDISPELWEVTEMYSDLMAERDHERILAAKAERDQQDERARRLMRPW
jgi:hypothetical protein